METQNSPPEMNTTAIDCIACVDVQFKEETPSMEKKIPQLPSYLGVCYAKCTIKHKQEHISDIKLHFSFFSVY